MYIGRDSNMWCCAGSLTLEPTIRDKYLYPARAVAPPKHTMAAANPYITRPAETRP